MQSNSPKPTLCVNLCIDLPTLRGGRCQLAEFWSLQCTVALGGPGEATYSREELSEFIDQVEEYFLPNPFQFEGDTLESKCEDMIEILSKTDSAPAPDRVRRELLVAELNLVCSGGRFVCFVVVCIAIFFGSGVYFAWFFCLFVCLYSDNGNLHAHTASRSRAQMSGESVDDLVYAVWLTASSEYSFNSHVSSDQQWRDLAFALEQLNESCSQPEG